MAGKVVDHTESTFWPLGWAGVLQIIHPRDIAEKVVGTFRLTMEKHHHLVQVRLGHDKCRLSTKLAGEQFHFGKPLLYDR